MRARSIAGLLLCGALFGLSYVLVRLTVPVLGPVAVTALRTMIGGGALLAVAHLLGQSLRGSSLRQYLVLGALSAAIPFSLISLSILTLDAGTAAVLNASSPMFALAIDSAGRRRWPAWRQIAGLLCAVTGVAVVMGARGVHVDTAGLTGVACAISGAAVFAYGGFYAARAFASAAPIAVAAGQQLAACVLLLPLTAMFSPPLNVGLAVVAQVLALGLAGSALAYLLFYWLIAREGPAWTANVNLLVSICGVLWGWMLLSEPIPLPSIAGMVLTVAGLALILLRSR